MLWREIDLEYYSKNNCLSVSNRYVMMGIWFFLWVLNFFLYVMFGWEYKWLYGESWYVKWRNEFDIKVDIIK